MTNWLVILFALLLLPGSAVAAEFTASVDSNHVEAGKSVKLQLTLSGVKAKGAPDIGALKQSFTIVSEEQSPIIININGVVSSRVRWQLTLIPKQKGSLAIPPVVIDTETGKLTTTPVLLEVGHEWSGERGTEIGGRAVSITAATDTQAPYQNQSILYIVKVAARTGVSRVSLNDLTVPNAIAERQGKPVVRSLMENGVPVTDVDFYFVITPLQPGVITIPPAELKGEIDTSDNGAVSDPLGGNFIGQMLRAMNAISAFAGNQTFSVASNKTVLNVKPPVAGVAPWLPLVSLKMSEDMSGSQAVHVGEPLSRKITLSANGAVGSQLPDVEGQQNQADVRVYTDKTTTGQDIDKRSGSILGSRTESFSLVPQKPGKIVLPAIRISWWNIATNSISATELPARTIMVMSGSGDRSEPVGGNAAINSSHSPVKRYQPTRAFGARRGFADLTSRIIYILAAILLVGLLFVIVRWQSRWRKAGFLAGNNSSMGPAAKPRPRKSRSGVITAAALKHVGTPAELKKFLEDYAHEHWGATRNASLERMFSTLTISGVEFARQDIDALVEGISAALYSGRAVDIEDLKRRCWRIVKTLNSRRIGSQKGRQRLACLNPD